MYKRKIGIDPASTLYGWLMRHSIRRSHMW